MVVELFYQGSERAVFVYGGCDGLRRWAEKLNRPPMDRLERTIHWIADLPHAELMFCGNVWKPVTGSKPKLFEIRKEQVRVYCCFCAKGIMMLHWVVKKQKKASNKDLRLAERRAQKVNDYERENKKVDGGSGRNA